MIKFYIQQATLYGVKNSRVAYFSAKEKNWPALGNKIYTNSHLDVK